MSVTHGPCPARPTITFPAAGRHSPVTGTKLYYLVTGAERCEQLAKGCYAVAPRLQCRIAGRPLLTYLYSSFLYGNAAKAPHIYLYKVFTTIQPPYLRNLISVQRPRNTRFSSVVTQLTFARPPTSSSLHLVSGTNALYLFVNLILVPVPTRLFLHATLLSRGHFVIKYTVSYRIVS